MTTLTPRYRRILLKIGGEALAGDFGYGIEEEMLSRVAREVKEIHDFGCEVAVVESFLKLIPFGTTYTLAVGCNRPTGAGRAVLPTA